VSVSEISVKFQRGHPQWGRRRWSRWKVAIFDQYLAISQKRYRGWEVPGCFYWVLPKRSIPEADQHRKYITIQQESLGTDML